MIWIHYGCWGRRCRSCDCDSVCFKAVHACRQLIIQILKASIKAYSKNLSQEIFQRHKCLIEHSCTGLLQQHCTSFSDDSMTPWLVFLAVASPQGKTAGRRTCDIEESKSILEIDILDLYLWWTLTHHKGKTSHSTLSLDIFLSNLRVSISYLRNMQKQCTIVQCKISIVMSSAWESVHFSVGRIFRFNPGTYSMSFNN